VHMRPRRAGAHRLHDRDDLSSENYGDVAAQCRIATSGRFRHSPREHPRISGGLGLWPATISRRPAIGIPLYGAGLVPRRYFASTSKSMVAGRSATREDYSPALSGPNPTARPLSSACPSRQGGPCQHLAPSDSGGCRSIARYEHPAEQPADRNITARLYGGDSDMRIRQEMILGSGGIRP